MRVGRAVAGHEVGSHHCVAASAKAAGYNDCDLGDLQRGGERCSPCHQLSAASYAPSTCRQATAAVMQAPPTHLHAGHSSRHAGPTHPPARRPQQPSCRPHPPTCTQATAAVMQAPPTHLHAGHSSRHAGPTHPPARRPQQPSCRPHPPTCRQATAAIMHALALVAPGALDRPVLWRKMRGIPLFPHSSVKCVPCKYPTSCICQHSNPPPSHSHSLSLNTLPPSPSTLSLPLPHTLHFLLPHTLTPSSLTHSPTHL